MPGHQHSFLKPVVLGLDQGGVQQSGKQEASFQAVQRRGQGPSCILPPLCRPPPGSPAVLQGGSSPRPWLQHHTQSQIPLSPRHTTLLKRSR